MIITNHTLHRSGRAHFTHPALTLGGDAKALQWIGVTDLWGWKPFIDEAIHSLPRELAFLASTLKRMMPVPSHLESKRIQRNFIGGYSEVSDL